MKTELEKVIENLERNLKQSSELWENDYPHAYIVGWLQGAIKNALSDLETINKILDL